MIKFENTEIYGLEPAIRGMRNPMNSWDKSDSYYTYIENPQTLNKAPYNYIVGDADKTLMLKLADGGPVHAKYRRMIIVYVDVTAPLYWWKEYDTYKIGTVANSCSTMHKIHSKEFTLDDFSHEHLSEFGIASLIRTINDLNSARYKFCESKNKQWWWDMIELLPTSYNQKRTLMLNYEVLVGIHESRKHHKLDEWREFCRWIQALPHSDVIIPKSEEVFLNETRDDIT